MSQWASKGPLTFGRCGLLALSLLLLSVPAPGWPAEPAGERWALMPAVFPELRTQMEDLPPFLRDTRLTLNLRTFYRNVEVSPDKFSEAWVGGGSLAYQSGWLWEAFSIGAIGYTSQPFYAPDSRDGTLLLGPGQQGFAVLGEAWARLKYQDHVLTGYRQSVTLGYVNPQDDRMVPNTFEGATLVGKLHWLQYTAGYLTRMKPRNEDTFISMSEAAGAKGTDEGAALGGLRLSPWKPFWVEASTAFAVDAFNTAFIQAEYTHPLAEDVLASLGAQYTDQRSVGGELLGSFSTWTVGGRVGVTFFGASIAAAFHRTGEDADIRAPYGVWPGYVKLIAKDFDRARETAWGIRLSYDFGRLGAPGLTGLFFFAQGTDAIDPKTRKAAPDRREYDFDVIYAPPQGWLRGFSFRARAGLVDQEDVRGLLPDIRLIVNYALPLF